MKRILLSTSLLLLFSVFNGYAQEMEMIKLTLPSGENIFYELTEKVAATTESNGEIKVAAASQSLIFPSGTKLVFTKGTMDDDLTSINTILDSKDKLTPVIKSYPGFLSISNLAADELIQVYSISGYEVLSSRADSSGTIQVATGALSQGVYIVKMGKIAVKCLIK